MHVAPGQNVLSFDRWMETYGYTYQEMFKEDVDSVMTTHITLRSFDDETHEGYWPIATYSKKLTIDLLKEKLGFQGAVITDALVMGGMATGDLVAETVQAFKCGADFLLWPPVEAAEVIEEKILSGEIPMSRLEDALARIERMEKFRFEALEKGAFDTPDPVFADKATEKIIKDGICLLRNRDNMVPLCKEKYRKALIINASEDLEGKGCQALKEELEARGIQADVCREIFDEQSFVCWQSDIDELEKDYDLVLFHVQTEHRIWNIPLLIIWGSHLFKKSKKVIINYGSEYFAHDYFPEDPTFIQMNCNPTAMNVKALAERLFGEEPFVGKPALKL